jgi:hypothetical protein
MGDVCTNPIASLTPLAPAPVQPPTGDAINLMESVRTLINQLSDHIDHLENKELTLASHCQKPTTDLGKSVPVPPPMDMPQHPTPITPQEGPSHPKTWVVVTYQHKPPNKPTKGTARTPSLAEAFKEDGCRDRR